MVDNDKYPNSLENLCSSDEYRFNRFKMIADGIQVNKKVSPGSDFVQVFLQHLHVDRSSYSTTYVLKNNVLAYLLKVEK